MIEAALNTHLFDRVMVSTDSEEFAEVARKCGAWVPFLRDPSVAKDTTTTIETACSDKARLEAMGESFDIFALLQPTSPLCCSIHIAGAVSLCERMHAGVVSVKHTTVRPSLLRIVDDKGHSRPVLDNGVVLRRQDESSVFELNGAVYVNPWDEIVPTLKFGCNPFAFVMDETSSVDIDDESDFDRAERILQERFSF